MANAIVTLKKFYETDAPTAGAYTISGGTINLASFEGIDISAYGRFMGKIEVEQFIYRDVGAGVGSEAQYYRRYAVANTITANTGLGVLVQSTAESTGSAIVSSTSISSPGTAANWAFSIITTTSLTSAKILTRLIIELYDAV